MSFLFSVAKRFILSIQIIIFCLPCSMNRTQKFKFCFCLNERFPFQKRKIVSQRNRIYSFIFFWNSEEACCAENISYKLQQNAYSVMWWSFNVKSWMKCTKIVSLNSTFKQMWALSVSAHCIQHEVELYFCGLTVHMNVLWNLGQCSAAKMKLAKLKLHIHFQITSVHTIRCDTENILNK